MNSIPTRKTCRNHRDLQALTMGKGVLQLGKAMIYMRTIKQTVSRSTLVLALSMSALTNLVNAQAQSLTSVNTNNNSTTAPSGSLKDSTGAGPLIEAVLKTGIDSNIGKNLAPIIGLSGPMPMKKHEFAISESGKDFERRACWVPYEKSQSTGTENGSSRPLRAYLLKVKRTGLDNQILYFRIEPNGNLDKAILSKSKLTAEGKGVRGSGVKTDLDINSPEVRKAFEAEMKFWLKDWLKKEQKNAAKKTADAAVKKPSTTAL